MKNSFLMKRIYLNALTSENLWSEEDLREIFGTPGCLLTFKRAIMQAIEYELATLFRAECIELFVSSGMLKWERVQNGSAILSASNHRSMQ